MSQEERISILNSHKIQLQGPYIAYWCFKSLRSRFNHSLEYAIHLANKYTLPLVVFSTTNNTIKSYSQRQLYFKMQALYDLDRALQEREIQCLHLLAQPSMAAIYMAQFAAAMVLDKVYLEQERRLVETLIKHSRIALIQVESNLIVPCDTASTKEEYAAYSIRPKLNKLLNQFLIPLKEQVLENPSLNFFHRQLHFPAELQLTRSEKHTIIALKREELLNKDLLSQHFNIDSQISPLSELEDLKKNTFHQVSKIGGQGQAHLILQNFLESKFLQYSSLRNDPGANHGLGYQSNLSPQLHWGTISPIDIILKCQKYIESFALEYSDKNEELVQLESSYNSFVEELFIRRELAFNFVNNNSSYTSYNALPYWAKTTLELHEEDQRPVQYTIEQLEQARTEDPYWNTAQIQLVRYGLIHGYMRMYWGKKILEWQKNPKTAFEILVHLNDKYAMDAYDPNGYTGIAWCFGLHDRPHPERPIFGKIRFMNAEGLRRKFDIQSYVNFWNK